jgi:DNA-binding transcriptional LysR family regulator
MDLRHLRYFVTVAQELHFGRAAKKLHISQPPLSQQIKRLEAELGVTLFERDKRHVSLTPMGAAFFHRARMILDSSQIAIKEVQRMARGEQDVIRVGFMSAIMLADFPPFLRPFHERYLHVNLTFQQLSSDAQYEALVDGRIDMGFVDLAPGQMDPQFRRDNIDGQLALRKKLLVALPAGHPLEGRAVISLNQLRDENFVMLRRMSFPSFFDKVIALCQAAGFSPRIVIEAESMPVVVAYCAIGMGVAIVPDSAVPLFKPHVSFVEPEVSAHVDIFAITRIEPPTPSVQALRSIVMENISHASVGRDPAMRRSVKRKKLAL